jgi:hypothetical protein
MFEQARPNFSNMFNKNTGLPGNLISYAQTPVPLWDGCDFKLIECVMGCENLEKIGFFEQVFNTSAKEFKEDIKLWDKEK